ncbi:GNAT family N-acetyltransferase [Streptomyces luteolus]|uniref:GNAT family N-acetyltransferase n=1 Tax=Streptomyces luteolus TaxID=3043615 RepID=A0ABT6T0N4_9ACTN|nr:GNAT family N-acetyltransferase [Streptomyces sp. B-S-A12]MDI3421201.1 GNAT family N-acetyltransferase [Streptomyces sp. B-S-A12]
MTEPVTPSTALGLRAVRLGSYSRAEQVEILGNDDDPFGVADTGLTWLPKAVHFGIRLDGRLVAHAGLLRLPVTVGDEDLELVGVGGVAVAADVRGRGLARQVLSAALDHARTMGPRHALLFCRPPLVALYGRLGWHILEQDVLVEQHTGPVVMPLRTMWTALREDEDGNGVRWPAGQLRLRSFPM